MVAIGAAADSHRTVVHAVVIPFAVIALVAMTCVMIFGAYRGARVGRELLSERGAVYIIGFVWVIVGLTLGRVFGLRAAGTPRPATIATAIGAVALAFGGPWLMRRLRTIMLRNRAGDAR
jgi:FtsH-binding integral membrane protein